MKVGILKETRRWDDRRVAITPETAKKIKEQFPHVELFIQKSDIRVHSDDEYKKAGFQVVGDVSHCDVLIGVKEVSSNKLVEGKTYLMFAHVAKGQENNRDFLKEMVRKEITLIDYEYLTDQNQNRVVAFGFWAGVVGAYYTFQGIARRYLGKEIPGPDQCRDLEELKFHVSQHAWPSLKIVITGGGRVASGAMEIMRAAGIREVIPHDFLQKEFDFPVVSRLDPDWYVKSGQGKFSYEHFFAHPEEYDSTFSPFTKTANVLITCHFWNPKSPVFFTIDEMQSPDFTISLVADVSCDVPGPIPSTLRTSTIGHPFYDVHPSTLEEKPPFSSSENITVMAVDNLPTALPMDASHTFSEDLLDKVFPALFGEDRDGVIERATILRKGKLTSRFSYLRKYLQNKAY